MRKPKKLTAIGKVRAELRAAVTQLQTHLAIVKQQASQIKELEIQLNEARRRTLPLGPMGQGGDINFLPLFVEKVETKRDMREIYSADGHSDFITSRGYAVVYVEGEITYFPPGAKKA